MHESRNQSVRFLNCIQREGDPGEQKEDFAYHAEDFLVNVPLEIKVAAHFLLVEIKKDNVCYLDSLESNICTTAKEFSHSQV